MLGPMPKVESHLLSSGAGKAGGKMLEENYLHNEGSSKRALTDDDDEQLLATLKQQLEKKSIEKEMQIGITSTVSSGTMPADDGANRNNNSLVDSRGCAKPEKKVIHLTNHEVKTEATSWPVSFYEVFNT